jgi:4-carboxymuconolactone decarboxylase
MVRMNPLEGGAMAQLTHAERRERGQEVLSTLRGGDVDPDAAVAMEARLGPLGSFVIDFALGDVWSRPGLSRHDRSLVVITILATLNQPNQLRTHVQGGINHGLTRTEVEEVFVQLAGYAGFPRAIDAMTVALAALSETQGLEPGPPADRTDDAERAALARQTIDRLTANRPPGGSGVDMGSFTGSAGRFAFGELWARDQLTRRERSLVVCATLTTQDKPRELRFHLQAALNHGATLPELEEVMVSVVAYVGFPTGVEGFRALREVEAEQSEAAR